VLDRFSAAIETGRIDVVPKVTIGGGAAGSGSAFEALLGLLLSDRLADTSRPMTGTVSLLSHLDTVVRCKYAGLMGTVSLLSHLDTTEHRDHPRTLPSRGATEATPSPSATGAQ
jgi:hypothetical protein